MSVVEDITPTVDAGRFPIKRIVGESVEITAACFAHGHEIVACALRYRAADDEWRESPMSPLGNDLWSGSFQVDRVGRWEYQVHCWIDHITHWRDDFIRRVEPDDIRLAAKMGAAIVTPAARRPREGGDPISRWVKTLESETSLDRLRAAATDETMLDLARASAPRDGLAQSAVYAIQVDRERARFSTWYEIFPRSCSPTPGRHGTFVDVDERLDEIAAMGFDVLYLPPIHPIGREKRKGKNNAVSAQAGDVGSPGRSARARAAIPPSFPSWARRPTSATS
jgi:starch synthase (maltosyl-transferring)